MIYRMIIFITVIGIMGINNLFSQGETKPQFSPPEVSQQQKALDEVFQNLNPDQMKYLPFFLNNHNPDFFDKMSKDQIQKIVLDSLNKFISDSGTYYNNKLNNPPQQNGMLFSAEIMMMLKKVSGAKISPNGDFAVYTLGTPSIEDNKTNKDLILISLKTGERKKLTDDQNSNEYEPIWSPKSDKIAFISTRSGTPQICTIDTNGKNYQEVTNIAGGVANIQWSPNGKWFSFTSEVKVNKTIFEKYPDLSKINARVYTSLPVRHWDSWEDENFEHLFIVQVDGTGPLDLMKKEPYECPVKPFGESSDICWSPDSKEIAYTSKKVDNYVQTTNNDIFVINIASGETKNITKEMKGAENAPLYSPDGKYLAFKSQAREGFESDKFRLMLMDRATGIIKDISATLDQWVGEMIWAPDSKSLYFSAEEGPVVQIYNMTIEGKWKVITKGWNNYDGGIDITPDGNTIVAGRRNMLRPHELYTVPTIGGEAKPITFENDAQLSFMKPAIIKERWFKGSGGKNFHSWIIYPPDFDSTKKYPMITYCQGGPQSTISQYFSLRWNLYLIASHGYVVVAPNRRGVPGFGQEWNDAISKDWGGKPMEDILKATDEMAKEPYINKDAMAAVGASAGGYATFWLEGNHEKRFKAFVSHCGVFDMVSKYGSTEELWFPNWEFGGPYWEKKNKSFYKENSPHEFANNWDTPILITTGEKDYRVPFTQSLEAFTLAQVKKIPSKLIVFPEENHWILKPQNQIFWYREFFDFLDTYCKKK